MTLRFGEIATPSLAYRLKILATFMADVATSLECEGESRVAARSR
jgi:hypothetical protein